MFLHGGSSAFSMFFATGDPFAGGVFICVMTPPGDAPSRCDAGARRREPERRLACGIRSTVSLPDYPREYRVAVR